MTLKGNHAFVSPKPQGSDPTRIYGPQWNADIPITGTADPGQLNGNVVQAINNDTNITGSISSQTLTLGWTGTLSLARGGTAANLSATGGAGQYLKQSASGAPITVGVIPASDIPGSSLTRTNDTNVTLTLGGTPSTSLLAAVSMTVGWSGTLAANRGGFGADVSAQSGIPLFATGVPTFTGTVGSGNVVLATAPTISNPLISTVIGGVATNSSLTLQSTNNGTPASDAIYFVTGNTIMGGWGVAPFASNVFSLKPDGTNTVFAFSATSGQLHYDNVILGQAQFNTNNTGAPNLSFKTVLTSNPNVVFGSITGNNASGSRHGLQISTGGSGNPTNPLEVFTQDGSGNATRRMTIEAGSPSAQVGIGLESTPNLPLVISMNTATNLTPSLVAASGGMVMIVGPDGQPSGVEVRSYVNAATPQPTLFFSGARGTGASPATLQSGDLIGTFGGRGYDGTVWYSGNAAALQFVTSQAWTSSAHGAEIVLGTTPNGTSSRVEAVRILQAGNVKFTNAANFSANGSVATSLGSVGPTGSHTTVQKWLTVVDNTGATLYIPAF